MRPWEGRATLRCLLRSAGARQTRAGSDSEEVGAVAPEAVTWDTNGKDAESVDYSRPTALLIEATKEPQKLIRQQQEEITRLVSQVKTIQASLKASGRTNSEARSRLNLGRSVSNGTRQARAA